MKQICALLFCSGLILAAFSCKTLKDVDVIGITGVPSTSSVTTALAGEIDFKNGEVLCASGDGPMLNNNYLVAKILTPASPATKNQAQVLFLRGNEKWTSYVIPSHKASNSEMQVGKYVLYSYLYSRHKDLKNDDYRKANWNFGRVTSTDALYKGMVEIKGQEYYVKWIRIPEVLVK